MRFSNEPYRNLNQGEIVITRRKVRSDAKLEQLNEAQHEQMLVWLEDENHSYTEVVARVQQSFGLSVGRTAVARYYQRHVAPLHHQNEADGALAFADLPDGPFDAATVKMARRLAWSAISLPTPDIDKAAAMLDIVRKAERQSIAERRLELEARRVVVREKEAAYRTRRSPPAVEAEEPIATVPPSEVLLPEHAGPLTAPAETPCSGAYEPSPQTLCAQVPSKKIPQNPPPYSPYFALIPALIPAEITPIPTEEISPAEIARVENILRSAEASVHQEESRQSLAHSLDSNVLVETVATDDHR